MARRRAPTPFLTEARGSGWRQRVTLEGSEDLREALRSMDRAISGVALVVAVDRGAAIVQDVMAQLAPRDKGDLQANIGREIHRVSPRRAQVDVAPKKEVWYGTLQEIGTSHHPPQPFMRPALDSTRDSVVAAVGAELRKVVEGIARGGA